MKGNWMMVGLSLYCMWKKELMYPFILSVVLCITVNFELLADMKNGFDLSNASIPQSEIQLGGPSRDGIPALDNPKFVSVEKVNYLDDNDIVIGFTHDGEARAYPTRILLWHEVVNDTVAGRAIVVTYCPLCATGMVFDRYIEGRLRNFGVSGLLYWSNVLMFDRDSDSLWSQLAMRAVSGPSMGQELKWLPSDYARWKDWKSKYPKGSVLSLDTGHKRKYQSDSPYASLIASNSLIFPVPQTRVELPIRARVVGVVVDGNAKAYPLKNLPKSGSIKDEIAGFPLLIRYDEGDKFPQFYDSKGDLVASVTLYWFAWQAFYPDTEIWTSDEPQSMGEHSENKSKWSNFYCELRKLIRTSSSC